MGSYSDVAIAIDKETYARHALLNRIPKILSEASYVEVDGALHWYLESQKWYGEFEEVRAVYTFIEELDAEGNIEGSRSFTDATGATLTYSYDRGRYGMVVLHENGETEEEGAPWDFEIDHVTYIGCPGRDAMLKREYGPQTKEATI